MKALVVGIGGIGKNVYVPQLEKLGLEVETVDLDDDKGANYDIIESIPEGTEYDIAIVCTPNLFHLPDVFSLAPYTKRILVEKPGFANAKAWWRVNKRLMPGHDVVLVKNNLYRPEYQELRQIMRDNKVTKVELTWFNENRIPNPGGWFTNKSVSFGGVSHDLFPHLYTFMLVLFDLEAVLDADLTAITKEQRWDLQTIGSTAYGEVSPTGVYDVCDYAEAHYKIGGIDVSVRASWKEGVDDQSIRIYTKDGLLHEWEFGLCPDEMYGKMLMTLLAAPIGTPTFHYDIDYWIHEQLENFLED